MLMIEIRIDLANAWKANDCKNIEKKVNLHAEGVYLKPMIAIVFCVGLGTGRTLELALPNVPQSSVGVVYIFE